MSTSEAVSVSRVDMTIGGDAVPGATRFDVINPATGAAFAQAPDATSADLDRAMDAARAAFRPWSSGEATRRSALRAMAGVLQTNLDELATLLTLEMGRPRDACRQEIELSAWWCRYYADLDDPPVVLQDDEVARAIVVERPFGVVAAITPWNYPILLAFYKIAPALRAGNTVVVKPSPFTPLTTLRMGELMASVVPGGVLNVISGLDSLGASMTEHPIPRKVAFTGSVATGLKVAASAALDLKRLTLELGGNDAAIVMDDVDVDAAVPDLFWSAMVNTGQLCCAVKRVYIPRSRFAEVRDGLAAYAAQVVVGDGMDETSQLGPLNNQMQLDKVQDLVARSKADGGRVVAGGHRIDRPGYFHETTLIEGIDDSSALVSQEQFGPALPLLVYDTVDEAIRRANDSPLGLNGSVWGVDVERAAKVAARLDVGTAAVNRGSIPEPHLPFGGRGLSGVGRENGLWGLRSFTEPQTLYVPKERAT